MTQTKPRFFVSADTSPHAKKRGFVPIGLGASFACT